ncbi:hypothetical protein ACMZ5F_28795 [Streptomyces rhizosphaericola]|uniref:hypothetical protein n=1 Tax=Streptomyces rhizosphaericola TaxID=2564098 RepID=UPI0039EEB6FB
MYNTSAKYGNPNQNSDQYRERDPMKKRLAMTVLPPVLLAGLIVNTGTAHADSGLGDCFTTGAYGIMYYKYYGGKTDPVDIALGIKDLLADGHHVAIRAITIDTGNRTKYWPWYRWYEGSGTGHTWYTTVRRQESGIQRLKVQVARFEKSKLLNSCTAWAG